MFRSKSRGFFDCPFLLATRHAWLAKYISRQIWSDRPKIALEYEKSRPACRSYKKIPQRQHGFWDFAKSPELICGAFRCKRLCRLTLSQFRLTETLAWSFFTPFLGSAGAAQHQRPGRQYCCYVGGDCCCCDWTAADYPHYCWTTHPGQHARSITHPPARKPHLLEQALSVYRYRHALHARSMSAPT